MIPSEYWVREEFDHELMRMITKVAKFTVVYHHGPYYGPLEPKMYGSQDLVDDHLAFNQGN